MRLVLFALFVAVPILELFVLVRAAKTLGLPVTIALCFVTAIVGSALARSEGLSVLSRMQARAQRGEAPTGELVDGAAILFAGALLLTPGFLTDAFGLLLLIPPTRRAMASGIAALLRSRSQFSVQSFGRGFSAGPGSASMGHDARDPRSGASASGASHSGGTHSGRSDVPTSDDARIIDADFTIIEDRESDR